MVAARDAGKAESILSEWRSAELAREDDERVIQQTSLFEVLQQRRHRLIGHAAIVWKLDVEVRMVIPRSVEQAYEANAPLDETPRQ